MKRLVICAKKEYGKRLSSYLRRELSADYRISTFSDYHAFIHSLREEEAADLYILTYDFRNELLRQECDLPSAVLYLSETRRDGEFCLWSDPRELLTMIRERFQGSTVEDAVTASSIVGVYSPFSPYSLMDYIWSRIPPGGLYLGFEDFSVSSDFGDTDYINQELYYYIHLRDSEIFYRLQSILPRRDGIYYLNSPALPFELRDLTESDFAWFIQGLRESEQFGKIYVSFGNTAATGVNFFKMFDQLIIMNWEENDTYRNYISRILLMIKDSEIIHGSKLSSLSF